MDRITPTEKRVVESLLLAAQDANSTTDNRVEDIVDLLDLEHKDHTFDAVFENYGVDEFLERVEIEAR